ncbi:MAG TPA: hypothetical protein VIH26_03395 [Anaerolineales bacterium]
MTKYLLLVGLLAGSLLVASCGPKDTAVLEGKVTLIKVIENGAQQPTPTPDEYGVRQIVVKSSNGQVEVARASIDPQGNYSIVLLAGLYVVDINYAGSDLAEGLPKTVQLEAGETIRLDVTIATGQR